MGAFSKLCFTLIAIFALGGCTLDVTKFASGKVCISSKPQCSQLNEKQLTDLRQWLGDRREGWEVATKVPQEVLVVLTDVEGKELDVKIYKNRIKISTSLTDVMRDFSVVEIANLRKILGVSADS